jgi:nitrate/nitrite transporter NarK
VELDFSVIGWVADRYGRRVVVAALGIIDAIGLYVLLNHPAGQIATMIVVCIVGVGLNTLHFRCYALAQDRVSNHRVAIATGFAGAIGYLVAGCAGPIYRHCRLSACGNNRVDRIADLAYHLVVMAATSGKQHHRLYGEMWDAPLSGAQV